jgi:inner membrane protein|tara:strand:+ start:448 stop:924 length:477 start_codon:yes stop_codon:yes gene_type:complete
MPWTHLLVATTVYLVFNRIGLVGFELPFFALLFGSIFPDIDHPRGMVSQFNILKVVSGALQRVVTHRGFTHGIPASLLFLGISIQITSFLELDIFVALGFFVGYILHLAADSLNPTGIKWFQPFHNGKIRWRISTGSLSERIFFFFLIGVVGILLSFQ